MPKFFSDWRNKSGDILCVLIICTQYVKARFIQLHFSLSRQMTVFTGFFFFFLGLFLQSSQEIVSVSSRFYNRFDSLLIFPDYSIPTLDIPVCICILFCSLVFMSTLNLCNINVRLLFFFFSIVSEKRKEEKGSCSG